MAPRSSNLTSILTLSWPRWNKCQRFKKFWRQFDSVFMAYYGGFHINWWYSPATCIARNGSAVETSPSHGFYGFTAQETCWVVQGPLLHVLLNVGKICGKYAEHMEKMWWEYGENMRKYRDVILKQIHKSWVAPQDPKAQPVPCADMTPEPRPINLAWVESCRGISFPPEDLLKWTGFFPQCRYAYIHMQICVSLYTHADMINLHVDY